MSKEEQFIAAMVQAVEERGAGFVYPREWRNKQGLSDSALGVCVYSRDTEGGGREGACIIGKALEIATGAPYEGANGPADLILEDVFGDEFDQAVLDAAAVAQRLQDEGRTWGYALQRFIKKLPEDLRPEVVV